LSAVSILLTHIGRRKDRRAGSSKIRSKTQQRKKNCGIQNIKTGGEFLVKLTKLALDE